MVPLPVMFYSVLPISLLITFCIPPTDSHDALDLISFLFHENYSSDVRPRNNYESKVAVKINFVLNSIADLDEVNQILYVDGRINAYWKDEFLVWNPSHFGSISHFIYPANKIWLPDFGISNSASTFTRASYSSDFRLILNDKGDIAWSFGGIFDVVCSMDLTYYPFDTQNCSIVVENWAYVRQDVRLYPDEDEILLGDFSENGLWEYVQSYVEESTFYQTVLSNMSYPRVTYTIEMRRKTAYYYVSIIVPCFLLVVLCLFNFWLPPDSGEKIGLGVTIILAFSVYQIVIEGSTPATSDTSPILRSFVMFVMVLATLSTTISIIVLNLYHRGDERRMNSCARSFFFGFLARVLCMRAYVPAERIQAVSPSPELVVAEVEKTRLPNGATEELLGEINANLKALRQSMREREATDAVVAEWKALAHVLDRFFFWLAFLATVIGSSVILLFRP